MFNFFGKKSVAESVHDWSFWQTDIHSHILPGIDDGAEDLEASISLIKSMYAKGIKKMIASPHISEDIYPNTKDRIQKKRDIVRQRLADIQLPMEIEAAAEYMIDGQFVDKISQPGRLLTVRDNEVLVEMSYLLESPYLYAALFSLQTHGYKPILAHPERYNFYHHKLEKYDELKEKGCYFQLNIIALSGYYGKHVKRTAEYLLSRNMYDYCGSDIHHLKHVHALHSVLNMKLFNDLKNYPFRNGSIPVHVATNAVEHESPFYSGGRAI